MKLRRKRIWLSCGELARLLGVKRADLNRVLRDEDHGFTILEIPTSNGRIVRHVPLDEIVRAAGGSLENLKLVQKVIQRRRRGAGKEEERLLEDAGGRYSKVVKLSPR